MSPRSLRTRFLLAGVLLVAVMAACGAWSVVTFTRLSAVIGETLRDNQDKIDLTATLASGLEREDDALLLALTGNASRARGERAEEILSHSDSGTNFFLSPALALAIGSGCDRVIM